MAAFRQKTYTDPDVVAGLQSRDKKVEDWFYLSSRSYFNEHFNEVFFDKDRRQEVFQSAFLKLWTEIEDRKIRVEDGSVCRQQRNGEWRAMTCSLTTFLMTFAKNENREIVRNVKEVCVENIFDDADGDGDVNVSFNGEEDEREQQVRIVDDCIQGLSPNCVEIITLFYYQKKSLDEILEIRRESNATKTGLKSAKAKCMATLRERAAKEMKRFGLTP